MFVNSLEACKALKSLGFNEKTEYYYYQCTKRILDGDFLEIPGDFGYVEKELCYKDNREYYPSPSLEQCLQFLYNYDLLILVDNKILYTRIKYNGEMISMKTVIDGELSLKLMYHIKIMLEKIWELM